MKSWKWNWRRVILAWAMGVGCCGVANGAVNSTITTFEEIKNPSGGDSTSASNLVEGTGNISHQYPRLQVYNVAAYVRPESHAIGAWAVADTSATSIVIDGGSPHASMWHNNRLLSRVDARFEDQLVIGPGSTGMAPGTPVQLQISLRLDGNVAFGGFVLDPGSTSSRTDLAAQFKMVDYSVTVPDEEGGPPTSPSLVEFFASIEAQKGSTAPNAFTPLGSTFESYRSSWTLHPNLGADVDGFFQSDSAGPYPTSASAPPGPQPGSSYAFSTGQQAVLVQTYVGASITVDARLNLLSQSRSTAPYAMLDFLDTFASGVQGAPGYEGLELAFESRVPEPSVGGVMLAMALAATATRRLGRRQKRTILDRAQF